MQKEHSNVGKVAFVSALAIYLLSLLCGFFFLLVTARGNWFNYLPTPDYSNGLLIDLLWISLALSIILTMMMLGESLVRNYLEKVKYNKRHNLDFGALIFALLGWWWIYLCCVGTGPLVLSFLVAEPHEFEFEVEHATSIEEGCQGLSFPDLSFWSNEICAFRAGISDQLYRGDTVVLRGFGTRFGIRVKEIVRIESQT